jgi:hypothetical protein
LYNSRENPPSAQFKSFAMASRFHLFLAIACLAFFPWTNTAQAARLVYHFGPGDCAPGTSLKPASPCCTAVERVSWFGSVRQPDVPARRPTHLVSFQHPYLGRTVTLPLCLPDSTPRMEYRPDRVTYNYGSYIVEVHFLPDGSADVIYNSGFFRAP